ncbi:MAG: HD domain-containing protein [Lachnospiraceae bacterium]|nr:HD domain-containing protein [Lachnospiraceae bacterium]MBR4816565.1 HD domain-containing protein [Lachnospiraceae bacterium]
MIAFYYDVMFAISLVMLIIYLFIWHKHFDIHFTMMFTFIAIQNLGYALTVHSKTLEEALTANKITYLGACFNILFMTLCVLEHCNILINKMMRIGIFATIFVLYGFVLTMGRNGLFYKDVDFEIRDGVGTLIKNEYGPMHTVYRIALTGLFLTAFVVIIYTYFKKRDVSKHNAQLLFAAEAVSFFSFFGGRLIFKNFELLPLAYIASEVMFLKIIHDMCLYDVTDSAIDSLVEKGNTGLISFDFKYNYLGSNETARKIFPEINTLTVDRSIRYNPTMKKYAVAWLDKFRADDKNDKFHYTKGEKIYLIDINYLVDGRNKRGYQFFITDDTKDQKYINLMNKFNTSLQEQVTRKTNHIVEMHNNLIMSMATMVESRDNSTGGHIKRTSECVKLLIDEIKKNNVFNLSEDFCKNIIKAAPMHDLGKIAVDDAILRKPGRFEPEEFEKMKHHAAEGARIVKEILKATDDADFRIVAENVAHFHHERWDGSGYPEGLKEEHIPLEARIMAIADVYDALVSKRVYKESMSFEKADSIIMEGMGKHFDEKLKPFYIAARPKLEAFYRRMNKE